MKNLIHFVCFTITTIWSFYKKPQAFPHPKAVIDLYDESGFVGAVERLTEEAIVGTKIALGDGSQWEIVSVQERQTLFTRHDYFIADVRRL